MSRNRTIYQSESLFVGDSIYASGKNNNHELIRVQGASYGFSLNKTDINQYGRQLRLDTVQLESPTVNFNFSYYLGDGFNEKNIGFDINADKQFVGPFMDSFSGNNFYMLTSDEGIDAVDFNSGDNYSLIGIGNAYLTNYSLNMSVGSAPIVELSYQAANINSQNGQVSGQIITGSLPSINPEEDSIISGDVVLKKPKDRGASRPSVIEPGNIRLEFPGFQSDNEGPISKTKGQGSFHLQSASLSLPMNRSELYRVGTKYSYARVLDYPINGTLTVTAVLSDIESENLLNIISECRDQGNKEISLTLDKCKIPEYGIEVFGVEKAMKITLKGVDLISEAFTSQVGSNKAVDVAFRVQVGSDDDLSRGVLLELFNNCFLIADQAETIVYDANDVEYDTRSGDIVDYWMYRSGDAKSVSIGSGVSTIGANSFNQAGLDGNLQIPDNVRLIDTRAFSYCPIDTLEIGKYLTGINERAFAHCSDLSSINFCSSNELKKIGIGAFLDTNLSSVTIPESINTLGSYVFSDITSLQTVDLTSKITSIPSHAFDGDSSLQSVVYLDSVTNIGEEAFTGCSNLSQMYWSENLESIGGQAFFNCASLPYVEFTENLEYIGGEAFKNCFSLAGELQLPHSLSGVGSSAFHGCSSLTSVNLGSGLTTLPNSMFNNCGKLQTVNFLQNLESIGPQVFERCESLSGIVIPDSVESIEAGAFRFCAAGSKGLTDITFGSGLKIIGNGAFSSDTLLETAVLPNNLEQIYGRAFALCGLTGHIEIPNSVYFVGVEGYESNYSLEGVTLSTSMDTIYEECFRICTSLTGIEILSNIIDIRTDAFSSCSSLSGITFFEGLETIGESAFEQCDSLGSLLFPLSLESIGLASFANCDVLSGVTLNEGLLSIDSVAFSSCPSLSGISYPQSLESVGSNCFANCTSLTYVDFNTNPNFNSISQNCFYGCTSLTGVNIPNNITSINGSAFYNNDSLSGVDFGDNMISIRNQAFRYCQSLNNLVFPSTLESIGYNAFEDCFSLETIGPFPESLLSIDNDAFANTILTGLLTIPDSVTYIGDTAFSNTEISGVDLGSGVDYLNQSCFSLNEKLEYINLDLITGIDTFVFDGCTSLSGVTIPSIMQGIESYAFRNTAIYDIVIPDAMDFISSNCFKDCDNLTGVISGNNITGIGSFAFDGCDSLLEYYPPDSLVKISNNAFSNCVSMSGLDLNQVEEIGSSAFLNCSSLSGELIIPDSVTSLGHNCFEGTSYSGVSIGSGITFIQDVVFKNADSLTHIEIPSWIETIGQGSFNGCDALGSFTLNEGLRNISPSFSSYNQYIGSFEGCTSLSGIIEFPSSLENLGRNAFQGCSQVSGLRFKSSIAPKTRRDAIPGQFRSDPLNHIVYAPLGSEASYSGKSYVEDPSSPIYGGDKDPLNWNDLNIVFE